MKYEFYIDTFFFLNFFMDVVLLSIVRKILRCTATHARIFLAGAFGAAGACIVTVFPYVPRIWKLGIGYGLIGLCMVKFAFRDMSLKMVLKGTIYLYFAAFGLAGFMQLLALHIPWLKVQGWKTATVCLAGYFSYISFSKVRDWLKKKEENPVVTVRLKYGDREKKLCALVDTGNSLTEPISRKAVSVVERKAVEELLKQKKPTDFKVIPFHSIGKTHGILEGVEMTELVIFGSYEKITVEKPVVGLFDGKLDKAGRVYQMILNPTLIKKQEGNL